MTTTLPTPAGLSLPVIGDVADPEAIALVHGNQSISYAVLADRVRAAGRRLTDGSERRLVLLELAPTLGSVVDLLGALHAGHVPVVVAPSGNHASVLERFAPDVRVDAAGHHTAYRSGSAHTLHPDLALLLSTSGSTGSPRLVRLSHANLASNAAAIARTLGIRPDDRAITTLPLHYCYGLSVLLSHLAAGAGVVLTDASVLDAAHWTAVADHGVTSISGVPHTFELLEASGFADRELPRLRYVTQAGGRMAPTRIRHWSELGQRRGFDLVLMYGQTEATARLAVLPPDLVSTRPECVGRAVAGAFHLVPPPPGVMVEPGVGELVHTGPGVMLGYAAGPADLSRGRDAAELRTGDLARIDADGLVEIVGRISAFLKVNGLRIDPARVEDRLLQAGFSTVVGGDDTGLVVALLPAAVPAAGWRPDVAAVRLCAADACGLPPHLVTVTALDERPVLPGGKLDRAAALDLARRAQETNDLPPVDNAPALAPSDAPLLDALLALYGELLGRDDVAPNHSFVDLGGDSLSYVETSIRLESLLTTLPTRWQRLSLLELSLLGPASANNAPDVAPGAAKVGRGRHLARLETSVVLRAVAIVLIVGTHTHLWYLPGGAHVLLAVAGFNLSRFAFSAPTASARARRVARSLGRIVVPAMVWMAGVGVLTGAYSVANVLMVNSLFGPDRWTSNWRMWFIEALVWSTIALTALLSIPAVERIVRRHPFAVPVVVVLLALPARLEVFHLTSPPGRGTAPAIFWLVALGWATSAAATWRHRLLLTAVIAVAVPGFFGQPGREALLAAGLLLLLWLPSISVPRRLVPGIGLLAASSLYVYLTHFEVYPHLGAPVLGLLASLAVGCAAWLLVDRLTRSSRGIRNSFFQTPTKEPTL